jgi:CBS domain-containing protein
MATIAEILTTKGSQVFTIAKNATVLQAANLMNEHRIGGLVVLDQGQIVGMFTERDVLRRIVGEQRDPAQTAVGDVMATPAVCGTLKTTIEEAQELMMNRRIRHLPIKDDDGSLRGLVSIGDINAYQVASHERTIHHLHEYVYGRT